MKFDARRVINIPLVKLLALDFRHKLVWNNTYCSVHAIVCQLILNAGYSTTVNFNNVNKTIQ